MIQNKSKNIPTQKPSQNGFSLSNTAIIVMLLLILTTSWVIYKNQETKSRSTEIYYDKAKNLSRLGIHHAINTIKTERIWEDLPDNLISKLYENGTYSVTILEKNLDSLVIKSIGTYKDISHSTTKTITQEINNAFFFEVDADNLFIETAPIEKEEEEEEEEESAAVITADQFPPYDYIFSHYIGETELTSAKGILVHDNHIYVCDFFDHQIKQFRLNGTFVKNWFSVQYPTDITVDPETNTFYVLTGEFYRRNSIYKINENGEMIWSILKSNDQSRLVGTHGAVGIQFHHLNKYLYITDQQMNRIVIFDSESGAFINQTGGISIPRNLAISQEGNIYITDFNNNRIKVVNPSGTQIDTYGPITNVYFQTEGLLFYPQFLHFNQFDYLFVITRDYLSRFQIFTKDFNYTGITVSKKARYNIPNSPRSLQTDTQENVYLTSLTSNKVFVYAPIFVSPDSDDYSGPTIEGLAYIIKGLEIENTNIAESISLEKLKIIWHPIDTGDELIKVTLNGVETFKGNIASGTEINLDTTDQKTRLDSNTSYTLELHFNNNVKNKKINVYSTFSDSSVFQYNIFIE